MMYIYEPETNSYNLCEWSGEHYYCSMITGKMYYV